MDRLFETDREDIFDVNTWAEGPEGTLPLTPEILLDKPSGYLFGLSQDVAMGWPPEALLQKEILILGIVGGIRGSEGQPVALGYHSGHWETGLLMEEAARTVVDRGAIPFSAVCSDPCDGRTQGTTGMFDSLAYRNDAAIVLRRLIRSLPSRAGVIGVATCDKSLPAMMMALAGMKELPAILIPGGVMLPPKLGDDAGKVQNIGSRFAHGIISLEEASELGCRACATPGGGCQFLGTAATSQVVSEALGLSVPHAALSPSGQQVWFEIARRSAAAVLLQVEMGTNLSDVLTPDSFYNAMVIHAAFGGSTNLLLHIPAIAHAAGIARPTLNTWERINQEVPRLVSVLPNGPINFPTVSVFLAGGVPEVMLHLRSMGLVRLDALSVVGKPLGDILDQWERSDRRRRFKEVLREKDGVSPDTVIFDPSSAKKNGLKNTTTFPRGNIAPQGSVIKSAAIDPTVIGEDDVYRLVGNARVFTTEKAAIATIKSKDKDALKPGDVLVLIGRGPKGAGMEEIAQLTIALSHLPWGKHVAVITDARFSGVSTGACIGHVGPEALAGGPIGKLHDGDLIEIIIDVNHLHGSVNLVGEEGTYVGIEEGTHILNERPIRTDLAPDDFLPDDTRLWAALQDVSGGTWSGCVYDVEKILKVIDAGREALSYCKTNSLRS